MPPSSAAAVDAARAAIAADPPPSLAVVIAAALRVMAGGRALYRCPGPCTCRVRAQSVCVQVSSGMSCILTFGPSVSEKATVCAQFGCMGGSSAISRGRARGCGRLRTFGACVSVYARFAVR